MAKLWKWFLLFLAPFAIAAGWYYGIVVPDRTRVEAERAAAQEAEAQREKEKTLAEMHQQTERDLRQIEANRKAQQTPRFSFAEAERMARENRWVDAGNYAINWLHYYPQDPQAWTIYGAALVNLNMYERG